MIPPPPRSTLFPYTTLFRSSDLDREASADDAYDEINTKVGALKDRYYEEILDVRAEEHTSELQSHSDLVWRLLLEKKTTKKKKTCSLRIETQRAKDLLRNNKKY